MEMTFPKASLRLEVADALIAAAVTRARSIGSPFAIAVIDESGELKAFARMDGASLQAVKVSQDKAYTAASTGMTTAAWYELVSDEPPLALGAVGAIERLMVIGGGYPVIVAGAVVGAIGVSGGHYKQDMDVAQAALSALALGAS